MEKHMARPVEFDEKQALTSAMEIFRRRGFAGVSIKTLEKDTGVSSGSLYNSFGSKDQLFVRAINHYNAYVVANRIHRHLEADDPGAGLLSMFLSLLDEPDGGSAGCLLTNTAVEFAGEGGPVADSVTQGFELLLSAFEKVLLRIGTIAGSRQGALKLLVLYQGLLVLIRHGHSNQDLRAIIYAEINSITGEYHV
jgi:AcrR family transcriptional regulator